jgi:hypothetical protein
MSGLDLIPDATELKQQQIATLISLAISQGKTSISVPTIPDEIREILKKKNYKVEYLDRCQGCSGDYGKCYCKSAWYISWNL